MSFQLVLEKYRKVAFSERDKGDRFERLIQSYLYTDPRYSHLTKVWLWNEFPYRKEFGDHDIGIDLVGMTAEGDYWAIQCKCYQESARINKEEVDTFLSTSGRSFKDQEGKEQRFAQRLWVSTTNNWSSKAEETLINQSPPVARLNLLDLQEAPVKWEKIDEGIFGEKARQAKKELHFHQREALERTIEYFKSASRGKLIMACGTGKTFTSLRIAEEQAGANGTILFLVPSIALLGQTLREWTADAREDINPIAICSDAEITREKKKNEDAETYSVVDLALPASTKVEQILKQFELFEMTNKKGITVIFSTYQSIDVISKTQKRLESIGSKYAKFDLIICDEAHRTTGVTLSGEDESTFVKVHDNAFINSDKRLYMTATPRLYSEDSRRKAEEQTAVICSMDDEALYGEETYRIGFGHAVERGLLSDYKVLILTLSETDVTPEVQRALQNSEQEIGIDDASKLIGCINAMSKQILNEKGSLNVNDPEPMRRAVAFTPSIKVSKKITGGFNKVSDSYYESVPELKKESLVNLRSMHIDGSMSATERDKLMSWLKEEPSDSKEARVLTNVRCLSEGVDVPSLDAVMFLSAKNSQVDVVQSVGRVMRKSPGKSYGYIIIPVVIPTDVAPEDALNDNERYKVVWTVLNALRAHDDRFNAIINKIDLNNNRPEQILIGRPDPDGDGDPFNDSDESKKGLAATAQLTMQFDLIQQAIYAKMVQKVGERQYWENWARDIADIAERHIQRITKIVDEDDEAHMAFREFVRGLRKNLNPSITETQAIEMLSQHIITKPVFEALFEDYSFAQSNAVSQAMQTALDAIEHKAVSKEELEVMEGFYRSVRRRAEGVDNAEGKQRIIVELYDKFFKTGFPKLVEQWGIVYTPVEVVDFIVHSVGDVLKDEFGRSLSDNDVNIIDPFTGTGTFITRLLQSGLIRKEDLERKYRHEIFANEYLLLAYYIGAVNIENVYHDLMGKDEYEEFPGIVLTDTFQLHEDDDNTKLFSEALAKNSVRLQQQKDAPIQVIIGNPPYSVGQRSTNDDAANQSYKRLDKKTEETYVKLSKASNKNSLYDPYIKAFRWATDRLQKDGGVIGFVSNGSWLDGSAQDGMRKSLEKDFTSIHIFNLRGNQRTSGETSRQEGGKIFGSGSRTPISITILVKNPRKDVTNADIHYHDIGDYLTREQKLTIIKDLGSINNIKWQKLVPNQDGDWVNGRSDSFKNLIPLAPDRKYNPQTASWFTINSLGVTTNRDPWSYGFSKEAVSSRMNKTISFFNSEIDRYKKSGHGSEPKMFVDKDPELISWTSSLIPKVKSGRKAIFQPDKILVSSYRPFTKEMLYFGEMFVHRRGQMEDFYQDNKAENRTIFLSGIGGSGAFSVLMTKNITDGQFLQNAQSFPLHYYKPSDHDQQGLFTAVSENLRHDGVSDFIWQQAKNKYGNDITKEDIFYYIYGVLHSPEYRLKFANDLKKVLPRLMLVDKPADFWSFRDAGRKLSDLHVNYEEVDSYPGVKVSGTQNNNYTVDRMKFLKKNDHSTIIYNHQIKIEGIPKEAYEYEINGKSAIEWILDRYQIKTDRASTIVNDPNDWAKEVGNPRYILDLLLSVINVSVQTVDIIRSLPKIEFETKESEL
jgi:predicted helicase